MSKQVESDKKLSIAKQNVSVKKQAEEFMQYLMSYFTDNAFRTFVSILNDKPLDNRKLESSNTVKAFKKLLISNDIQLIHTLPKDTELFRCRKLDVIGDGESISCDHAGNLHGFDSYGSKEPPITVSGEGRNNISGASYLYLAEDVYTACAEIHPNNLDILSVAKFKLKNELKLFDLSVDSNFSQYDDPENFISATKLISLIMARFYLPVSNKKEYLISQYFSDLIRKYGFDGVCYMSSMSMRKNYAIFNCGENNIEFIDSELIRNHITIYNLYRINDSTKIEPEIYEKIKELTAEDIKKIKEKIIKQLENKHNGQVKNADGE